MVNLEVLFKEYAWGNTLAARRIKKYLKNNIKDIETQTNTNELSQLASISFKVNNKFVSKSTLLSFIFFKIFNTEFQKYMNFSFENSFIIQPYLETSQDLITFNSNVKNYFFKTLNINSLLLFSKYHKYSLTTSILDKLDDKDEYKKFKLTFINISYKSLIEKYIILCLHDLNIAKIKIGKGGLL